MTNKEPINDNFSNDYGLTDDEIRIATQILMSDSSIDHGKIVSVFKENFPTEAKRRQVYGWLIAQKRIKDDE